MTGVSGSGKSTLVNEMLYKAVANRLHRAQAAPGRAQARSRASSSSTRSSRVDQSPIGRTPRSNPATYIGLFDQIRELFSKTQEARARGYKPGRFSFNVKGGRCEVCRGDGQIKIEMHFLPDVYVPCEQCHGKRYNRETLDIRFKGKNIADVLEMPIEEALEFFAHIPKIKRRLQTLHDVGLDYMRLGQPATTLSGGEAQRVKLASRAVPRSPPGRTLYILDEPTTGLHFADIEKLLEVLQRLVDAGNSVVVIEHNLDVIKTADRLIDMGPEGGEEGGVLMAAGTPEEVAAVEDSYTGRFLRDAGVEPAAKPRAAPAAATPAQRRTGAARREGQDGGLRPPGCAGAPRHALSERAHRQSGDAASTSASGSAAARPGASAITVTVPGGDLGEAGVHDARDDAGTGRHGRPDAPGAGATTRPGQPASTQASRPASAAITAAWATCATVLPELIPAAGLST